MISVVIPTLNAETTLVPVLAALIPAAVDGIVREVIVVDCGSSDRTRQIADASGARLVEAGRGRGVQLRSGGLAARHDWLLFLHADSILEGDWHREVMAFIDRTEGTEAIDAAAVFRFALDDTGFWPRLIEWGVRRRCAWFKLPYGDQGLLIPRRLYDQIGGYQPYPLFEDVDIVRRLGRRRINLLGARATTSAQRYRKAGYVARVARNWYCIALYYLGASPERLEKVYHG